MALLAPCTSSLCHFSLWQFCMVIWLIICLPVENKLHEDSPCLFSLFTSKELSLWPVTHCRALMDIRWMSDWVVAKKRCFFLLVFTHCRGDPSEDLRNSSRWAPRLLRVWSTGGLSDWHGGRLRTWGKWVASLYRYQILEATPSRSTKNAHVGLWTCCWVCLPCPSKSFLLVGMLSLAMVELKSHRHRGPQSLSGWASVGLRPQRESQLWPCGLISCRNDQMSSSPTYACVWSP